MNKQTARRQLTPIPFTQVSFDDPFWAPRQEVNRSVSIPHMYQMCMETGRIPAFDLNFTRAGPSSVLLIFGDSDPAKWLEAAGVDGADLARGPVFNQVSMAIDAAVDGQGVALARTALVAWDLLAGRLACLPFGPALPVP